MKVSIIGGGGLVGSMTAYALQCGGVVSSICLIDANQDAALGQATDLLHGASLVADQRISAGAMSEVASSNIVVITAGLRRKPDESRLDLINRNVDLFLTLLDQVKAAGLKDSSYLVVVSNPVDVLTYLAVQRAGLPWQRVIGWVRSLTPPDFAVTWPGGYKRRPRKSRPSFSESTATAWCRSGRVPRLPGCRWSSGPALIRPCKEKYSKKPRRPARS